MQLEALRSAKKSNPEGRWWVKADACDIRKGIRQSMAGKWAGDEDLGDKTLQVLYAEYTRRCKFVKELKFGSKDSLKEHCETLLSSLHEDSDFLAAGEQEARKVYENALHRTNLSSNSLMEFSWAHIGFEELQKNLKKIQKALSFITSCVILGDDTTVKKVLYDFKKEACTYLKDLYMKKRTAASHLLTFMISDERRNSKPYAIPVRFLPYQSITDKKMRDLEEQIETEMKAIDMVPVGKYTLTGRKYYIKIY